MPDHGDEDLTAAAYAVGGHSSRKTQPMPCSAVDEFCFFCEFEGNPKAVGSDTDLYGNLVDLATHLGSLHREAAHIANHLYEIYGSSIQMHIENQPEWTRESIIRHITNSGQFKTVFDTGVTHMFTNLIAKQNADLCDISTGMVIEDNRRAFCDTVKTFVGWRASLAKTGGNR
jgi:hypothetical protein|tara:strand:+ start:508 stop:1026 length:519 start_codon:yes stop_codon:yes gene_type:complete